MRRLLPIAGAVLADAIRQKVVWIVLIFAAVLSFAVPSLPSYGQGVVGSVYREVTMALMFVASMTVGLALGSTRIQGEVQRRTVFTLLARDVRRWHYLVGTWAGIVAVTGLALAAFTVIAMAVGLGVYGDAMPVLILGAISVWLETGVVVALALLVSTWFSPVTAIVASLALLFIGHSVTGLMAEGAGKWLPTLDIFNVTNPVAHGSGYGASYAVAMIAAFIGWSGVLMIAASAAFSRRDL